MWLTEEPEKNPNFRGLPWPHRMAAHLCLKDGLHAPHVHDVQ